MDKYNLDIISIAAIASAEQKKGMSIEFTINLAHKGTVVIKQKDKDLYAAIDVAVDRAQKVLRRHHDKITGHRQTGLSALSIENEDAENIAEGTEDEIIPVELELYKPLEIDEALNKLKDSDQHFLIFNDHDDKTRVLYKRNDGKFGLY
jgi:putative sigma-54 modulation protein